MLGTLEIGYIENLMLAAVLALPRLMVCMFLVPVFDASTVPRTLRIAVALGFGLPVIYGLSQNLGSELHTPLFLVSVILKEVVLGLLLGIVLSTPFWAISGVGVLLDNQRGANAGSQGTPMGKADESMIGIALQQSLVVLLVATGGLSPLYQLMLGSFDAWPVLSLTPDMRGADAAAIFGRFSEYTRLALLYAAPVLASLLLIDFAFALIGLAAPALPTYFAAMPVKSILGLFILAVYLWTLLDLSAGYFRRAIEFDSALINHAVKAR